MSTQFTIHTPINDFIADDVRRTGIFEELDVDSCCGGYRTLAEVCTEKGIDPETVLNRLMINPPADEGDVPEVKNMDGSLAEAVDHILLTHHTKLKEALPRLAALLDKVVNAHLERHPELSTVQEIFGELRANLEPHLTKEEQELFPMIKQLESSGDPPKQHCETEQNSIRVMMAENQRALPLFEKMRAMTQNFRMPEDGCESYRLLLSGLDELEIDTLLHVQKENEILFPQVLALEEDSN